MPCGGFDYVDDYIEVLTLIANYCAIHNVHYFVIGGDLNLKLKKRSLVQCTLFIT